MQTQHDLKILPTHSRRCGGVNLLYEPESVPIFVREPRCPATLLDNRAGCGCRATLLVDKSIENHLTIATSALVLWLSVGLGRVDANSAVAFVDRVGGVSNANPVSIVHPNPALHLQERGD